MVLLGTIWGPHALHGGEQSARRLLACTATVPSLTRRDVYSYVLGVKGSSKSHDLDIHLGHWGANVGLVLVMTVIVYELPSVCGLCNSAC